MGRLSPAQIRGARGLIDWSMLDLARAARVSVSTVKRFEDGKSEPGTERAMALMQDALETEGVQFLADDGTGVGVRCRRR